jgi:PAS domain S-box-containing protein
MFLHPNRTAHKTGPALLARLGASPARTRYVFALLVVCISAALAWLLSAPNRVHSPLLLLAGVAVCGACAGIGPAIVASVLNSLTVCWLATRVHQHPDPVASIALFIPCAGLITWLSGAHARRNAMREEVRAPSAVSDPSLPLRLAQNTRCILYEAEITGMPGWQDDPDGIHNRFQTTVRVPDEAGARRVLPLRPVGAQDYWAAWRASRVAEDIPHMTRTRARALVGGKSSYSLDFRCTDERGQIRWLHEDVTLEALAESGRWHAFGVVTDVTEAKRIEEALRQSEQRFVTFMDNLPGPAFIKDEQGRLVYLNRSGISHGPPEVRQDWRGRTAAMLFPPDVADELEAADRAVLQSRQPVQLIERLPGTDGVIRDYLVNKFCYASADGRTWLGGVAIDVTEQRRAEEELRRQTRLLETLIEATPVGVQFVAADSTSRLSNVKFADIRPVVAAAAPALPDAPPKLPAGANGRVVETISSADGRVVVRWSVPVHSDRTDEQQQQQQRIGQVTFVQDVTEQERDKQRLRALARELSRADGRERRRVATLLHDDVGQMLTCALMELEQLREAPREAPREASEDSEASIARIKRIIEQTLETTRSLTVQLSPPALRELGVPRALEWLAGQTLQTRGIDVRFDFELDRLPLDEEPALILFQSVREIFANVIKHAKAHHVVVSARVRDATAWICVEDDGVGFDAARCMIQPEVGNHFGLFNIREQLSAVGGTVEFESEPGRFTRAQLSIPLKALQASENG